MKKSTQSILQKVNYPPDLKKLNREELLLLVDELRDFIIDVVSRQGGHLSASLGVAELSVAIHYLYNTPNDKLVWDVGHQAYIHKLLTGRKKQFENIRKKGGISGFPKITESEYDTFGTGHSSTSISAILGMAISAKIQNISREHIAVIGDGALTAGQAFEALNNAGNSNTNITIIINDNGMSIDPNVGSLKDYLESISKSEKQKNLFEALGFKYSGPIDGNDLNAVIETLSEAKKTQNPKVIHLLTTKGKGYSPAEIGNKTTWHAPGYFNKITGEINKTIKSKEDTLKYQDVFGKTLVELAKQNEKIVAITPAMTSGSSLNYMMEYFPNRCFDVGIAEQHAVTFSAGLAADGLIPFCAIYSTFLQRAYDQLIHDVALQNLPVIFCIDRAGLVGEDGATHHGAFDLAYLRCIPNMIVAAPLNESELRNLMFTALETKQPFAIRYPRGKGVLPNWQTPFSKIEIGKAQVLTKGKKVAVLSIGHVGNDAQNAIQELNKSSLHPTHIDIRFLKPLDVDLLKEVFSTHQKIITVEDGAKIGGLYSAISEFKNENKITQEIIGLGIPDKFIEHASQNELKQEYGFDITVIKKAIENSWHT